MRTSLKFEKRRTIAKLCPCGRNNKDGKFAPFKGYEDKGYCHSCAKCFFPQTEIEQTINCFDSKSFVKAIKHTKDDTAQTRIPNHYILSSMRNYERNNFVSFIHKHFASDEVEKVIDLYKLGTSHRINGSVVFWYIDKQHEVRSGKIMQYNSSTGNRVKDCWNSIRWVHELASIKNFHYENCLFGEHQLKQDSNKVVAIVESEKTAIISSLCMPQYTWLATGGLQNFKASLLQILDQRRIIAYPDIDAYGDWKKIAGDIKLSYPIVVSDFLERRATAEDRTKKLDIGDFLLRNR